MVIRECVSRGYAGITDIDRICSFVIELAILGYTDMYYQLREPSIHMGKKYLGTLGKWDFYVASAGRNYTDKELCWRFNENGII